MIGMMDWASDTAHCRRDLDPTGDVEQTSAMRGKRKAEDRMATRRAERLTGHPVAGRSTGIELPKRVCLLECDL